MQAKDHNSLTPIALIGAEAYRKNPLNISRIEKILFIATLVCWGAQLATYITNDDALAYSIHQKIAPISSMLGLITFFNSFETWKGVFSFLGLATLSGALSPLLGKNLTPLLTGLTALEVGLYSKRIFSTLKTCLKNAYLGKSKALFKAIVSCTPKINAISAGIENLKLQAKIFGLIDLSECEFYSGIGTSRLYFCNRLDNKRISSCNPWFSEPVDSECDEAFLTYEKYKDIVGYTNDPLKVCRVVLNNFEGCSDAIQSLNENCNEGFSQACLDAVENFDMLNGGRGPDAFSKALQFFRIKESGTSWNELQKVKGLAEKEYHAISLKTHSDKNQGLNEAQKEAAVETFNEATNALKTIRNYVLSKKPIQTISEE